MEVCLEVCLGRVLGVKKNVHIGVNAIENGNLDWHVNGKRVRD